MNGQYSVDEDGNYLGIESKGQRIRTVEQLVKAAKVDLKVWEIERHLINKWEVGAKDANDNLVIEPLWQVKVWLIKRKLEPIEIVLRPMQYDFVLPEICTASSLNGWHRAMGLFDFHFGFRQMYGKMVPFHDRKALDVALQIAQSSHFDGVYYGGDIADLAEWSDKFVRGPEFVQMTQPAVIEGSYWFGQFRQAAPSAKHIAIEGNHDYRMRQSLMVHLVAAYQLKPADELHLESALSVPRLFGFDHMGIEWVEGYPDAVAWLNDDLCVEHGDLVSSVPGATAGKMLRKGPVSRTFGHIHRRETAETGINDRDGRKEIAAGCPGCLCRVDGVVPGHKRRQKWQQGLVIMNYNNQGDTVLEMVPIKEGAAIYRGKIYKARRDINERIWELGKKTGYNLE